MNRCEDHTLLMDHLNNHLDPTINIIDATKTHTLRIKKIDSLIQDLKQKIEPAKDLGRKKSNVNAMLATECPFSLVLPLSNQEQDAIIYIDKNAKAIDYSQLNNKLFIILQSDMDHDVVADKSCLENCLGKFYPQLGRALEQKDLASLDETTIDLDYLNHKLNLIQDDCGKSNTPIQDQITWLNDLKNNPHLSQIPKSFFLDNRLLLLQKLDPNFINKKHLLCYLEKISDDIGTEEDINPLNQNINLIDISCANLPPEAYQLPNIFFHLDQITFLKKLDTKYFSKQSYIDYIRQVTGSTIKNTLIAKLNYLIQYEVFLNLYPKLFDLTPVAWFIKKDLMQALSKIDPQQINNLILNGAYLFSLENIDQALFTFQYHLGQELSNDNILHILEKHQKHPNYSKLIQMIEDHLPPEFIKETLFKPENRPLCNQIYRTYSLSIPEHDQSLIYQLLDSKIKQRLLEESDPAAHVCLTKLIKHYQSRLDTFSENVEKFAKKHFNRDKQGKYTNKWTLSTEKQLKAYQDIHDAIENKTDFSQLTRLFKKHELTLMDADSMLSSSSDLYAAVINFHESVGRIFESYHIDASNNSKQAAFIIACLLDDNFFRFITDDNHYAKRYGQAYFNTLEIYRPDAFEKLTQGKQR